MKRSFERYVGIDYSGAALPTTRLPGLRVYMADRNRSAFQVGPSQNPHRNWTRQGIAEWLVVQLGEGVPTIVGIDHAFSFPLSYFEQHGIEKRWQAFVDDFCVHWRTDQPTISVESLRVGNLRLGNPRWKRLAETCCRAKSVFHFDVNGSVAKSSHSGIPWLRYIGHKVGDNVHFWPFDGWNIPLGKSVLTEVYPALWNKDFLQGDRDGHQQDAYCVAETIRQADSDGRLRAFFEPNLDDDQRKRATIEGWILGLVEPTTTGSFAGFPAVPFASAWKPNL